MKLHQLNLCTIPRSPVNHPKDSSEFDPATEESLERLRDVMASVKPGENAWTQRDVEGLLANPTRLQERLRSLLVELAPACPVIVASGLSLGTHQASLEQMLSQLKVDRRVHPEGFSDDALAGARNGCLLSFTSAVSLADLAGKAGIIEKFGFWPATLRETLCLLCENPELFQLGDVAVCGSVARQQVGCFPFLSRFASTPSLESRRGGSVLQPERTYVFAFEKSG